jgi:gluconate 2-dehydrogenase alpha chain
MPRKLPPKDVVIIGLGWTGSILGYELAKAGLDVVAIERGPWRDTATDFPPAYAQDELRYAVRLDLFLRPDQETLTFRNNAGQTALPIRNWVSFLPGNGVGGAGIHWNGQTWRFLPTDFRLRNHLEERYGKAFLPADMTIQDWPLSYDELEPYYDRFEKLCGTSGKAGNIRGAKQPGGNPFEGWRSSEYPTPPLKQGYGPTLFAEAARKAGHSPFPQPASNLSEAYTNPLGLKLGQCTYCGFRERFGCGNYSKASPQICVLPALLRFPNFSAQTDSEVVKINLDNTGKRASGVTYVDTSGEEWEQPASIVLVCAFSLFNVRLMLLSGIGKPYDPQTGQGVVGRNYAYQTTSTHSEGQGPQSVHRHRRARHDHRRLQRRQLRSQRARVRRRRIHGAGQTNARPILTRPVPAGTPKWGAQWKKATAETYQRAMSLSTHGSSYSYRDCFLDLDPTYKDRLGRPLMRMTFDFHDNELKMSAFLTDRLAEIARGLDPVELTASPRKGPYTITAYQTTHNTGGTVMGKEPATSVLNRYCQSWDVHNVFVPGGASVFPQNHGYNPTDTVGALAYWTADAIKDRYLKSPGPLG